MSFPPESVKKTVQKIGQLLKERNETISISEAACGGLISAYIVSVAGASQYYHGGTLTYSLKSRLKLSGWSDEETQNYTGPSQQVAEKLARTLRFELGTTYCLSETSWAGPGENAGQTYIAISSDSDGELSISKNTGIKDRSENMLEIARLALEYFLVYLEKKQ